MTTRFTTYIENFNAGEISPLLRGRLDTKAPSHGFRSLENFYVIPQGGIRRREGTKFVSETLNSSAISTLIPYIINGTTAAIIEVTDGQYRTFTVDGTEDGSVADPGSGYTPGSSGSYGSDSIPVITNNTFTNALTGWTTYQFDASSVGGGTVTMSSGEFGTYGAVLTQNLPTLPAGTYTLTINGNYTVVSDWGGSFAHPIYMVGTSGADLISATECASTSGTFTVTDTFVVSSSESTAYVWMECSVGNGTTIQLYDITITPDIEGTTSDPNIGGSLPTLQTQQGPGGSYFTDELNAPGLLFRDGGGAWSFSLLNLKDGPYFDITDENYGGIGSQITVTTAGGAVNASITITSSANLFVSTDVGRLIRIRPNASADWGYAKITAFTSATSVSATVKATIANTSASLYWRLGAWSDTTGYPRSSAFHEQRLVYGGTTAQPQTIWGSYVGQHDNFAPDDGSADENITALTAYTFTLATDRPELIQWLVSQDALLIGTNHQVHRCAASDYNEALNARNVNVKSLLRVGSARVNAQKVGDSIIFPQLYRRQLLEMYYNTNRGRHDTRDLMVGADHLADLAAITASAYQEYPYKQLWYSTNNGTLLGLTYRPEEGIIAWHRHFIGGSLTGKDHPVIESMAVIPGPYQDDLWMIVKRTIDGATFRSIEILTNAVSTNDLRTDMVYLDAHSILEVVAGSFSNKNTAVASTYQMDHLIGETVTILVNDVLYGTDVVDTDGTLTTNKLPSNFTPALSNGDIVKIGLPYVSYAETNIIEPINNLGHGPGQQSRIYEMTLRLHNSLKGEIGYQDSQLDDIIYPTTIDPTDPTDLFTGDIRMKFPHGWERDTKLIMRQSDPYPFTATMLVIKMAGGNL